VAETQLAKEGAGQFGAAACYAKQKKMEFEALRRAIKFLKENRLVVTKGFP